MSWHDLNCVPWPFADDTFEEVHAYDVLEHLEDVVRALEEIYRISRHGASRARHGAALFLRQRLHRSDAPALVRVAQFRSVPRGIDGQTHELRPLRPRALPRARDPHLLSSLAHEQAGVAVRQPLAARLRAPLGLDVPGLVLVRPSRPRQGCAVKVVHLTPALFGADGIVGGGERYAFELARHMASAGADDTGDVR